MNMPQTHWTNLWLVLNVVRWHVVNEKVQLRPRLSLLPDVSTSNQTEQVARSSNHVYKELEN